MPFRFENVCLEVEGFSNLVKTCGMSFKLLPPPSYVWARKLRSSKIQIERLEYKCLGTWTIVGEGEALGCKGAATTCCDERVKRLELKKEANLVVQLD